MSTKTETVLAYLGGYFDGEGSVTSSLNNNHPGKTAPTLIIAVKVQSGDKATLDLYSKVFGGSIKPCKRRPDTKRQQYTWALRGSKAQTALWALLPYLSAKLWPAAFAVLPTYIRGAKKLSSGEELARKLVHDEIRNYNQRVTYANVG